MVVSIKKILLTLILTIFLFGGTMAEELTTNDRLDIIDVMSSYAKGIDTKDFDFYGKIFSDDVEVNIIYDPNFRSGGQVTLNGKEEWVSYVKEAVSKYQSSQHMMGNPLIVYEGGIAKVRTDIQATHYYKEGDNKKSTLWGHYNTHMKKLNGSWKVVKHTLTSIGSD
jgi:ketosteroid isomerase-like protein|tara:strand:- start:414 stop:914 length:501 start_codon:yes stop_codon:yes gene_type:complete